MFQCDIFIGVSEKGHVPFKNVLPYCVIVSDHIIRALTIDRLPLAGLFFYLKKRNILQHMQLKKIKNLKIITI